MPRGYPVEDATRERVAKLLHDGLSWTQVTLLTGVARRTVARIARGMKLSLTMAPHEENASGNNQKGPASTPPAETAGTG